MDRNNTVYSILMSVFVVTLVLTNIIGTKIFLLFGSSLPNGFFGFPIALTAGIITYPITFLITDVTSEVYGKKKANLLVIVGFFSSLLSLLIINIVINLEPAEAWITGSSYTKLEEMNTAFNSVFKMPSILLLASMSAYLVAQLIDIRIFHYLKNYTNSKHLWLRNNLSTWFSQLVDTIIVNSIFLGLGMGLEFVTVVQIIIANYIVKLIIAALDTPLIYIFVKVIKQTNNQ